MKTEVTASGDARRLIRVLNAAYRRRTVGQCLLTTTAAVGGNDDPTATLPDFPPVRSSPGAVLQGLDGGAVERLEAWMSAAGGGADISGGDTLKAACLASLFADELLEK